MPIWLFWDFLMTEDNIDHRTLANMHVALERVCGHTSMGEQHEVRKRVAHGIVQCARNGKTTVGALTQAGERALVRIPEAPGLVRRSN